MGNAAAKPISQKEFDKYGITPEDVMGFNQVVQETRKKSKSKKLEKKDLDHIHKYCMTTKKKKRKKSSKNSKGSTSITSDDKDLDDLLSKHLSVMETSVSMTEEMSGTLRSSSVREENLPSVINISDEGNEDFSVLGSASVMPKQRRGHSVDV